MRRVRNWVAVTGGIAILHLSLSAQDAPATNADPAPPTPSAPTAASSAAATAEQQGTDEQLKRMAADIESLRASNQALSDKLSAATEDNRQLRADFTKFSGDSGAQDQIKALAQKLDALATSITEVDKKRVDDKQEIADQIQHTAQRLERLIVDQGQSQSKPVPTPIATAPDTNAAQPGEGVKYTIKDGDMLVKIERSYNEVYKSQGKKLISMQQIMDANPKVDWKHLKIGQQIIVPLPPE